MTALAAVLGELRDVLTLLPSSAYVATPWARLSGSVGEHVRHCLDHVSALVNGDLDLLTYDHRRRGSLLERDPRVAVHEIERLWRGLDRFAQHATDRPVRVCTQVSQTGPPVVTTSTTARELAAVVDHTIHHCAIIAILLAQQGVGVPARFGLAASTPERVRTCA
jgi:hypothetical protein